MLQVIDRYPFGRFLISSGVGMAYLSACVFGLKPLEHACSEKALPYVLFGIVVSSVIGVVFLNVRCSSKITVPLGLVGWVLAFVLLFLQNWA